MVHSTPGAGRLKPRHRRHYLIIIKGFTQTQTRRNEDGGHCPLPIDVPLSAEDITMDYIDRKLHAEPDGELLDSYSRPVSRVVELIGPSVAQITVGANRRGGHGSGFVIRPDGCESQRRGSAGQFQGPEARPDRDCHLRSARLRVDGHGRDLVRKRTAGFQIVSNRTDPSLCADSVEPRHQNRGRTHFVRLKRRVTNA